MSSKPQLKVEEVKEALKSTNGYIQRAADKLGRCRQTLAKFINKTPSLVKFKEELNVIRGDRYETTLDKMALGEVSYEEEMLDNAGHPTGAIVVYRQKPFFPALKLALEICGRYTPKQENINKYEGKLVAELTNMGGFAPIFDVE